MSKKGILLINLGTPDTPSYNGLRRYLNQFLTDRRVIDLPAIPRHMLFKGIVVPMRSNRVAKLYRELWIEEGSPLKVYGKEVALGVQQLLGEDYHVELAMRYQNPSIESAIDRLQKKHVSEIVVFPLFPQYASATSGSIFEEVMRVLSRKEQIPFLRLINSYYDHPGIIDIYANNARRFDLLRYDHFVFSFHGVPKRYLKKENHYCRVDQTCCDHICDENQFCYAAQCHATARAIARQLNLSKKQYTVSFQSRFGPEEWIQPYTDKVLQACIDNGQLNVIVFSPAFVADCLETTIEIGVEYKEDFMRLGGETLDLVPSLNNDPDWIKFIVDMVK